MNKFLICVFLAVICALTTTTSARPVDEEPLKIRGGVRQLDASDFSEAEEVLQLSLTKLAAGEGPHLKLAKIHSASKQIVSGSKYKINADFNAKDSEDEIKNCDVTIWSQPWLPLGIEITFECKGEDKLSEEEANETLKYVISKYEEVEMKIIGEPVSIYGLRLLYGDTEEELNIHFKYIDNTPYDIIQNCVFALYHRQNECELIKTICNTFLPITPRPLLQRKDLRICDDGNDVQLVEKEELDEEETTAVTTTDAEQIVSNAVNTSSSSSSIEDDGNAGEQSAKQRSGEAEKE